MNVAWRRIKDLFGRALELPAEERTAFLEAECAGEPEILKEVTDLIESSSAAGEFIDPPPGRNIVEHSEHLPRMLGDDFELLHVLGQGGMGVVYYARQLSLKRHVAVKVQSRAATLTQAQVDRFHREAEAAAKLKHPNIAPLHSAQRIGDLHFYAMEYIPGHDLAVELRLQRGLAVTTPELDAPQDDLSVTLPDRESSQYIAAAVTVCRQIARAIQAAHDGGVIHRDIKPSNILLDPAGVPYLVDFGLAKLDTAESATLTGEQAGSPHYMSPEQVSSNSGGVDYRTDIYSLGVVLYEQLAFRRPFEAANAMDIFELIRQRDPIPLRRVNSRVPRDLETICHRAMAKDPAARFSIAGEFADDLDRFLNHEAIRARPPGAVERAWRLLRRNRFLVAAATVIVIVLFGSLEAGAALERKLKLEQRTANLVSWDALDQPETGMLAEAQKLLRSVSGEELTEEGALAAASLTLKIAARKADLLERGRAGVDMTGFTGAGADGLQLVDGWYLLQEAMKLADEDDEELRRLVSGATVLPRLSVIGEHTGARVYLRPIQTRSGSVGPRKFLGVLPVEDLVVPTGHYRIIVVVEGLGMAEYTRYLSQPGFTMKITARVRPTEDVIQGMQLVPAGSFLFGVANSGPSDPLREQTIALDAFYCDLAEVSNAEFEAFLHATGHRAHMTWATVQTEDSADLPATGVSWVNARAFAEWRGKRLISNVEWERAARGTDGRLFPWGNDPADAVGNFDAVMPTNLGGLTVSQAQARLLWPVRSCPEARTPDGFFHMFGNAAELTETAFEFPTQSTGENLTSSDRIVKGETCMGKGGLRRVGNGLNSNYLIPSNGSNTLYGFRCAKSVTR